jgi:small subunit ribosomal protein S5
MNNMEQITTYLLNNSIRDITVIDSLVPDLKYQIIERKRIHKRTKSKKLMRNKLLVVAGDPNIGIVGVGQGKNEDFRKALNEALNEAKKKLTIVKKGCGNYSCSCKELPHSISSRKSYKTGSTLVELVPSSTKQGLRTSPCCKIFFSLAGIEDITVLVKGNKNNKLNMIKSCYEALRK